jgi:CRP/FNR family transcriptional regulator, dissimilatory nitrate respiration regulator
MANKNKMNYTEVLSQAMIFRTLSVNEIEDVLSKVIFQYKKFSKDDIIAQAGTPCEHVRVVVEGKVSGEMMDLSGKVLKIEDILPSMMIAPAFLYGKRRKYPVNVISMEETCVWQMHRDDFTMLLQKNLALLDNFLNAISSRAQFLSEKIKFVSFPSIKAKIAGFILHYAQDKDVLQLPITHQQMSELFGVARPSLSREIRNLNTDGIIESEREVIRILDRRRLTELLKV